MRINPKIANNAQEILTIKNNLLGYFWYMRLIMILDEIETHNRDNNMSIWSNKLRPFGDTKNIMLNKREITIKTVNIINRYSNLFNKETAPFLEYKKNKL